MNTDLTTGSPDKLLWKFSVPMLLSVIFQQLYNIVDSIVAGKFIGENALAAVGVSYPVTMIFMAIATGSNIGCSVVISQLFGGKEYKQVKTSVFTSLISIGVLSILLTITGLIICNPLMKLLNTPQNIFPDAALYLRIYIGGLVFLFLYNICTGIFTALGDSKTPLFFLIISSLGNIILDLIFVICFHMGVAGVAWATFIAQGIASILSFICIIKRIGNIEAETGFRYFSLSMLGRISRIAVPSILQQSFISVGNLFIQRIINHFGSGVIAGYSAAIKLNTFAITSFTTLANGVSSFTAQNIGAGKPERVKKGFWSGLTMAFCVAVPFFLAFCFFSTDMIHIFLENPNAKAISTGDTFLRIVSPFYFVISIKLIADGILRGSGSMIYFMIATFTDLILRVILSFFLSGIWGSTGVWISWPIGWIISTALSCIFFFSGKWKKYIL